MAIFSTAQAAERLGVSVRRVQQLVKDGRLPAEKFGGALVIKEEDLKLVKDRKVDRQSKAKAVKSSGSNKKTVKKPNTRAGKGGNLNRTLLMRSSLNWKQV